MKHSGGQCNWKAHSPTTQERVRESSSADVTQLDPGREGGDPPQCRQGEEWAELAVACAIIFSPAPCLLRSRAPRGWNYLDHVDPSAWHSPWSAADTPNMC